jgi:hypothetical protein
MLLLVVAVPLIARRAGEKCARAVKTAFIASSIRQNLHSRRHIHISLS